MATIAISAWVAFATSSLPPKDERSPKRPPCAKEARRSETETVWTAPTHPDATSDERVSTKVPSLPDPEQAYYWSDVWQRGEAEAAAAIAAGEGIRFESAADAIRWLESDE